MQKAIQILRKVKGKKNHKISLEQNNSYRYFDKQLFEQMFKDYFNILCNFAQSYNIDEDNAKEITQEVFINLWQKKETIDTKKSIKSYLFTSVKNRCLNYIRDQKKFRSNILDIEIADFDFSFENDVFTESELQSKIDNAISNLPEKCRQIFKLSRFEELKYKEIAEKLDVSVKTVEAQISKALKILRNDLKDYITILLLTILIKIPFGIFYFGFNNYLIFQLYPG
ncbi:MAG: RNA polymerase sigma-70 factor [Bacteroidales bacterium]|nr:RNA polymerase sigma-70 factor [Bacteroidales bacterium]